MRYPHVIWDFDGTLVDTYPAMAEAARRTLLLCGIHEPADEIMAQMKISITHALQYYGTKYPLSKGFVAEYEATRKELEREWSRPFPGVAVLCKRIVAAGGSNYICTHRGESLWPMMECCGLSGYFADATISADKFPRKPDPAAVLHLLAKHAIAPERAIMVGDREIDILAGKNAGIAACFVWGGECAAADFVAEDAGALEGILCQQRNWGDGGRGN